jgi:antitoxin (DNA-binding transcriptional repressor) of toxin-antitoxin stability system
MLQVPLTDAQSQLPELIHQLSLGDEVVITENNVPVAKLITTLRTTRRVPQLGTQRGSIMYMASDFDAPLADFRDSMW